VARRAQPIFSQPGYAMGAFVSAVAVGLHINHAQGTLGLIGRVNSVCEPNIVRGLPLFFNAKVVSPADIRGEHSIIDYDPFYDREEYTGLLSAVLFSQNRFIVSMGCAAEAIALQVGHP
jgi:hypothetical protein